MISEDYVLGLQSPGTCGKRPRSPVDKLADLAAATDDDEQDWRSSKRYLAEVIANGFSRLSFNLTGPQQQQQQPAFLQPDPASYLPPAAPQQPALLPGQLTHQAGQPLTEPLQLNNACCPMDTQLSPSADACSAQQFQQQLPNSAFTATSTGCKVACSLLGSWPLSGAAAAAGQEGLDRQRVPPGSPPSPESQLVLSVAAIGPAAAAAAEISSNAATAVPESAGFMAQQEAAASTGASVSDTARPNSLPPLQTAKVLRAAEKQPNSPSDLPAASLRKVALLRSLLARAEQQVQQQQGTSQHPVEQQQQQPSRMQQTGRSEVTVGPQGTPMEQPRLQRDRHQHIDGRTCRAIPDGSQNRQQQQHTHHFAPRPVNSWDMSSDDMECSSNSSFLDSDGSSSHQGALEATGSQVARPDQDPSGAVLLCQEVLGLDDVTALASTQQHSAGRQPVQGAARARHDVQLPFCSQHEVQHLARSSTSGAHPAQQQQQSSRMLAHRQSSPELNLRELDALRAKALATSSQLTCSTQEDLHSLQVGLASRRGSCDSHTPSGLQQVSGRGNMPVDVRRRTMG